MPTTNQDWADRFIHALMGKGVTTFFVAPGSRSTPLVAAVARRDDARAVVHFDERGNAFAALGYGKATGKPAAWITTSGTAVANGLPAVVEASIEEVPLLLLTADRPPELRTTSANQTIDQVHIFGSYTRFFFDVPAPNDHLDGRFLESLADHAVHRSRDTPPGPVHLNFMFREPLAPATRADASSFPEKFPTTLEPGYESLEHIGFSEINDRILNARRGLVVAGRMRGIRHASAIHALAVSLGWPLFADILSQARTDDGEEVMIPYYDLLLSSVNFSRLHLPDVVLYFGKPGVSKRLHHFLRDSGCYWVQVDPAQERIDPELHVDLRIKAPQDKVCSVLSELHSPMLDKNWLDTWKNASDLVGKVLYGQDEVMFTELDAVSTVVSQLDHSSTLFLGNSLPIRLANNVTPPFKESMRVDANRGASGIDGILATATGICEGSDKPVVVILGDLSFLHDLNSLALINKCRHQMIIVVLNNDGGGIFSFLPIADEKDIFTKFFATPHGFTFRAAAELFDLRYALIQNPGALKKALDEVKASGEHTIIEIVTERQTTKDAIRGLEKEIERKLVY